nr:4584_t:CDS:2 [Entrophospora candida]
MSTFEVCKLVNNLKRKLGTEYTERNSQYYTDWDCLDTYWKYCEENNLTYNLFGFLIYAIATSSVNIKDHNFKFNLYNIYKCDHDSKQPIQKVRVFQKKMVKKLGYENLLLKYQSSEIDEIEISIGVLKKINDKNYPLIVKEIVTMIQENMAEIPSDLLEYVMKYISLNQRYEIPSELNEKEFGLYRAARKLCESFMDLKLKEQYKKDNYIYERIQRKAMVHGSKDGPSKHPDLHVCYKSTLKNFTWECLFGEISYGPFENNVCDHINGDYTRLCKFAKDSWCNLVRYFSSRSPFDIKDFLNFQTILLHGHVKHFMTVNIPYREEHFELTFINLLKLVYNLNLLLKQNINHIRSLDNIPVTNLHTSNVDIDLIPTFNTPNRKEKIQVVIVALFVFFLNLRCLTH